MEENGKKVSLISASITVLILNCKNLNLNSYATNFIFINPNIAREPIEGTVKFSSIKKRRQRKKIIANLFNKHLNTFLNNAVFYTLF